MTFKLDQYNFYNLIVSFFLELYSHSPIRISFSIKSPFAQEYFSIFFIFTCASIAVNMRTFSDPKPKVRGVNFYLILTRLLAQVNIKTKLHKVNLEFKN